MLYRSENGMYFAAFSIVIMALLMFLGLLFGISKYLTAKNQAQAATQVAANAFIKTYSESTQIDHQARVAEALAAANSLLALNPIPGTEGAIPAIDESQVHLGAHYLQPLPDGTSPCASYPCFVEAANDTDPINSVRISTSSSATTSSPFYFFTNSQRSAASTTTAAVQPLCVDFLIDKSASSAYDSHFAGPWLELDGNKFTEKRAALPAYRGLEIPTSEYLASPVNCNDRDTFEIASFFYCTMYNDAPHGYRPTGGQRKPSPSELVSGCQAGINSALPRFPDDINLHFGSDFNARAIPWKVNTGVTDPAYIDTFYYPNRPYVGWTPQFYYMEAVNRTSKWLSSRSNPGDMARIQPVGPRPEVQALHIPNTFLGFGSGVLFTDNFSLLAQLTDMRKMGLTGCDRTNLAAYPQTTPHFLTMGYFPLATGQTNFDETDLYSALKSAISNMAVGCPIQSKRYLVLLSDGVNTCNSAQCGSGLAAFNDAYSSIIGPSNQASVLDQIKENQISVVSVIAGSHVHPNTKNLLDPTNTYYMKQEEVIVRLREPEGMTPYFVDDSSFPDVNTALAQLGKPGQYFGLANLFMFTLASETGGSFCPVRNLCVDAALCAGSCYENDPTNLSGPQRLKKVWRDNHPIQDCAEYSQTPADQAATCVINALKKDRFRIVQ